MNQPLPNSFRSHSLWDCSVSFLTTLKNTHLNYNGYGYLVAVGLDNAFDLEVEGQFQKDVRVCIFNRKVNYQYAGGDGSLLISIVEPHSNWGRLLSKLLGKSNFHRMTDPKTASAVKDSNRNPLEILEGIFGPLLEAESGTKPKRHDERMIYVLDYLRNNLSETIELAGIADLIHLSPERMRHLFKEQMGVPFTKYVLWHRLRGVLHAVTARQVRLNQAVGESGFTDQAHFNHIFKNIFGVSPKVLLDVATVIM